ncbi:hypothetical protein [Nonomuraea soli]|uniref:Uncharacterized protein n=1 Tax=Nonomuraea soli TaxID=1032476 RepID=A0A7W0CNI7_9ACTN|nr:hypothetical protein [Nonomuraea soli]MBA2894463.1 hypothetical protein [Nonomuraea soli]
MTDHTALHGMADLATIRGIADHPTTIRGMADLTTVMSPALHVAPVSRQGT